jgi:F-type H+-transporting ATPase subunit delta
MNELSREYAGALFIIASEKNCKSEYASYLDSLCQSFSDEPMYLEFLHSPAISTNEKISSITKIFSSIVPEDVLSFVQLMCEKGRINLIFEAAQAYKDLVAQSDKVIDAVITSAVELTEDEKKKLQLKLENKFSSKVNLTFKIDPSLLGGIVVETDGKILDGSIKNRLRDLKEVIK